MTGRRAIARHRRDRRRPGLAITVFAALLLACVAGSLRAEERPRLAPDEFDRILSHGPWPMPWTPDPSNRTSGRREAIDLGRALFFERRLSRFGALSCAFCHQPAKAWTDGRAQASSVARLDRNTQALFNVRDMRWFGWDGAADSLWMQSLRPLLDPRELAASPEHVQSVLSEVPRLARGYHQTFGHAPRQDAPETTLINAAKALAAYQETIITGRTAFDEFRDALARKDQKSQARYPAAALRGLKLFVGKGACSSCHAGPLFTNGEFHDIGLRHFTGTGAADPGRHGGLVKLKESPYTRLSRFSDDQSGASAWATRHVAAQHRNFGEFKVPSLRNVALTAPYMHNGSKATLADVIRHYSELDEDRLHVHGEKVLRRLDLSEPEMSDLVAFLESLTSAKSARTKAGR